MGEEPGNSPLPFQERGLIRAVLKDAARDLAAVSSTPRLDAELLMAHAIGASREQLLLRHLDDPAPPGFDPLLARRRAHEPVAYITGCRAFWSIELAVGPGVLIPRPDSETLLEAAVAHFGAAGPARVLDLGTGPGTLLLAALAQWPGATGLGIDASATALDYARANAETLGLAERATFRLGDWAAGVTERFDLILANPPYVGTGEVLPVSVRDFEPPAALYAARAGLGAYHVLLPQLPARLASGGVALVEIGASQGAAVSTIAAEAGLKASILQDLGQRVRVLLCRG